MTNTTTELVFSTHDYDMNIIEFFHLSNVNEG